MVSFLINVDLYTTHLINNFLPHNNIMDIFNSFFSQRGLSLGVWFLVAIPFILFEERNHKRLLLYLLVSLFLSLGVVFVVKKAINRPRPKITMHKIAISNPIMKSSCPTSGSFPSGHTTIAFTVALVLSFCDKKRRWLYYTTAFLIGLSRIYLQCHFFLDVLSGAVLGLIIGGLSIALTDSIISRVDKRF